jgi:hypothetical protein
LQLSKKILVAILLATAKKIIALSQQTSYIMHKRKINKKKKDMEK